MRLRCEIGGGTAKESELEREEISRKRRRRRCVRSFSEVAIADGGGGEIPRRNGLLLDRELGLLSVRPLDFQIWVFTLLIK